MARKRTTPGSLLLGELLIADQPLYAGAEVFKHDGSLVLTFVLRPDADLVEIVFGLTSNQALQLIERLSTHSEVFRQSVAEGRGGAKFPDKPL
jgi:hypothetical protein